MGTDWISWEFLGVLIGIVATSLLIVERVEKILAGWIDKFRTWRSQRKELGLLVKPSAEDLQKYSIQTRHRTEPDAPFGPPIVSSAALEDLGQGS